MFLAAPLKKAREEVCRVSTDGNECCVKWEHANRAEMIGLPL